jgi:hypothetical protein
MQPCQHPGTALSFGSALHAAFVVMFPHSDWTIMIQIVTLYEHS